MRCHGFEEGHSFNIKANLLSFFKEKFRWRVQIVRAKLEKVACCLIFSRIKLVWVQAKIYFETNPKQLSCDKQFKFWKFESFLFSKQEPTVQWTVSLFFLFEFITRCYGEAFLPNFYFKIIALTWTSTAKHVLLLFLKGFYLSLAI